MADRELQPAWEWLWTIMECTESQLRFGTSLSAATDPSHAGHPLYDNQTKVTSAKEKRTAEEGSPFEKKGRLVIARERKIDCRELPTTKL